MIGITRVSPSEPYSQRPRSVPASRPVAADRAKTTASEAPEIRHPPGIGWKSATERWLSVACGLAITLVLVTLPLVGNGFGGDGPSPQALHQGVAASAADLTHGDRTGDDWAGELLDHCIRRLALGAAFDAKLRQRVWATGREVTGVGSYEQAGEGTGQFHLQLTMHDGDGKHTIRQISDGKLAWTRTEIAQQVTLKRVNLGALDANTRGESEWPGLRARDPKSAEFRQAWKSLVEPPAADPTSGGPRAADELPAKAMVGGLVELLHQAGRDFDLRASGGKLAGEPVWILAGPLRESAMARAKSAGGLGEKAGLPVRYPTRIRVAIAARQGKRATFATGIPLRFEYWHDPPGRNTQRKPAEDHVRPAGQLISLVEIYSIQEITRPSPARFRFVNDEHAVHFVDETEYYKEFFPRPGV